jgi:hypothetical protein
MEQTMTDTRPRFSRLTDGGTTKSWRAAIPAVIVVVIFVGLLAYLASSLSSAEQKKMSAERDAQQIREQSSGLTKQIAMLQKENALAKSPGRTTVILEPASKAKDGKDRAAWVAVTWGELPDGKSFLRANAYGLQAKLDDGKTYHLWLTPQTGDPIDIGQLEADQSGSGFIMTTELPAVDQGKSVMLTADAPGSKQPGQVLAKADLPKLKPSMQSPESAEPQAKSGSTSQQMHQEKQSGDQPPAR